MGDLSPTPLTMSAVKGRKRAINVNGAFMDASKLPWVDWTLMTHR